MLQLPHAPRYGAGDFNVAHLPWPAALAPGRVSFGIAQGAISALAVVMAVGAGSRAVALALTALVGWCYFGSQLDSYQHHYLVWLVLLLWSFAPRAALSAASRPLADAGPVRSVALRLVLMQLGILYLWAAVSKLDARWIDGSVLALQLGGWLRDGVDATLGIAVAARLVIVAELVLAVTVWRARTWRWAWPLGLALHGGIAISQIDVGLFSYLMLALSLLMLPEALVARVAPHLARRRARFDEAVRWPAPRRAASIAALVGAAALVLGLRPPLSWPLAVALIGLAGGQVGRCWRDAPGPSTRRAWRLALAAAATLTLWVAVDRQAGLAEDYHRLWGSSARRLGDLAQAERAYRALVRLQPAQEQGHFQLGRLLIQRGALDEGLAELRRAEAAAPHSTRALTEQARALSAAGRQQQAEEVARRVRQREGGARPRAPQAEEP